MTFTVALPGVALLDVRYKWLAAGVLGPELSSGITAVGISYEFRISCTPPTDAEELYAYDVNDASNYAKGRYHQPLSTPTNFDLLDIDESGRVNVGSMNDASVAGTGQPDDLWRGA